MTDLPEGWTPRWSPEEDAAIRETVGRILREATGGAIDLSKESDPLIDLPLIAALAGVQPGTPGQWIQRSKAGLLLPSFPEPDDQRYVDKPQWRAISTIVSWLWPRRWPPGVSGRPESRGTRKARKAAANGLVIKGDYVYDRQGNVLGPIVAKTA